MNQSDQRKLRLSMAIMEFFKSPNLKWIGLNSSKFSEISYFSWYFKASKCYQDSKITSLSNKILRLTEAK